MSQDHRARLKQWLESGEARLQPLTLTQRELWEASPVPPGDVSNHICAFIRVRGPITQERCEAAFHKVVDRQEVFRLSFLPGKDQPLQLIRRTSSPALTFRDLPSAQQHPEAIEELAQEIFDKPFDLVGGPLYRSEILRLASDDHILVFSIHHAIADGWTLGVFVQDLFAAYLLGLKSMESSLPPVPLSYTAWGAAERAFWQPAELEKRAAFWKPALSGATRFWKDSPAERGRRERWVTHLPADLGRGVRELARRSGATLFSTLLAAFQITLSKWTGADDVLVGTPVANRNRQAVRETMGYCAGIVPLRGQIDRTRKFSDSLREVHQNSVDAFANAMPFVELVRLMNDSSSPGHNPLFEVRFALQNHPVPDVNVPSLGLQLRMRSTGTFRFDLACEVTEEGDELEVVWLFRQNMFPLDEIQNLNRLYQATLAGVCRSPEILTSALMTAL
ncbi:MAG TPA: condensation domain protein [Verrucomicrobiales bacterium]|nr:condensation domain protein [Verrucomicrobiales bacterium]